MMRLMKIRLVHKVIIAIIIPIVCQLGFFYFLLQSVRDLDELERIGRRTTQILFIRGQFYVEMTKELLCIGLYRATSKPEYKKRYYESAAATTSAIKQLAEFWRDDPVKMHILKWAWAGHKQKTVMAQMLLIGLDDKSFSNILGLPDTGTAFTGLLISRNSGNLAPLFTNIEKSQPEIAQKSLEKTSELYQQLLFALLITVFVSISSGVLFSRSVADRIRRVMSNVKAMENHEKATAVVGGSDEIAMLNSAILDTDRQIRAAEEFQTETAHLIAQELERPIDQLSESMAQLRQSGFISMTENGKVRVERTLLEINRLRILVRDLDSLDKICSAGWDLDLKSVDLSDIARSAVDTVYDFAKSVNVEIVCDLAEVWVLGDPVRLQQIALNLLTNAIKFSPAKSRIEVTTNIEHRFGKLSITDHGTGIPEEFQQYIFGKFEQASRSDSTEKGGSGLGLAISKRLVESQKGRMGFSSKLGQGSTFWLSLPMESLEEEAHLAQSGDLQKSFVGNRSSSNWQNFRPTLLKKGLLLAVIPIAVQVTSVTALWIVIESIRHNVHEFEVVSKVTGYHARILESGVRGFMASMLYNAEQNSGYKKIAGTEQREIEDSVYQLRDITKSDKSLEKTTESIAQMVKEYIALQNDILKAEPNADGERWFGESSHGKTEKTVIQINEPLRESIKLENKLLAENMAAKMQMERGVEQVIIISMIGSFIASIWLGLFMIRAITSRVQQIVKNTERLVNRQELDAPLPGNDEISFVDHSFYDAANRLTQLERLKQEIISITSHEFRTPLSSLLAKIDLMHAGVFGELNSGGEAIVISSRARISDLIVVITNLLDVEKIQSGKSIVVKSVVDVSTVLKKVVQNVSDLAKERNIDLRCVDDEFSIHADEIRLTQALTAALADIVAYSQAGETITLSAHNVETFVQFRIDGPGGNCSKSALNPSTARGRLANKLLTLIVEQHGGAVNVEASKTSLLVSVKLPQN